MLVTFYLFAVAAVAFASGVLLFRSPIYCALSLVASFFCLGGIYVMMNAEFVAMIQVLVYAGAIMVLFLFVIMLFNTSQDSGRPLKVSFRRVLAVGVTAGLIAQISGLFLSDVTYGPKDIYSVEKVTEIGSIATIGHLLYGEFVLPFEIISIMLLVAVVGAVVIAKRRLN